MIRVTDGGQFVGRVLIVDDDPIVAGSLREFVSGLGYDADVRYDAVSALEALSEAASASEGGRSKPRPFNLLLTDASMPGVDGLELVRRVRESHPEVASVVLTGYGTIEGAVRAIREGAFDYLSKPVVDEELKLALERALRQQVLLAENCELKRRLGERFGSGSIVSRDLRMAKAIEMIEAVSSSKATVLMTGESGTGKSLLARSIHERSPRARGPFVEIHCGSIPEALLESELFGHVKGSFTGAHADKSGKFLAADGGTIFIDEINSATPAMQLKLLRVLQERCFEPVGSTETIQVDVRVVLAANEPLEGLVREGRFRQDLYYRINVVQVELPPLRERPGDVVVLAEHFIEKHASEHGKAVIGMTSEALESLRRYAFPGNVRELENVVERAVVLSRTPTIGEEDLPPYVRGGEEGGGVGGLSLEARGSLAADDAVDSPDTPWVATALSEAIKEPEKRIILKALRANDWNRTKTAEELEINRTTLYKKMRSFGIDRLAG